MYYYVSNPALSTFLGENMHITVKWLIVFLAISAIGTVCGAGLPLVVPMKLDDIVLSLSVSAACVAVMFFCIWALKDQWHQPMYKEH
jgi:hypothetical protein